MRIKEVEFSSRSLANRSIGVCIQSQQSDSLQAEHRIFSLPHEYGKGLPGVRIVTTISYERARHLFDRLVVIFRGPRFPVLLLF